MAITLNRIGWEDAPSEQTPIDSGNLKQMENNAEDGINDLLKLISSNMTRYLNASYNFSHTGSSQYLQEPIKLNKTIDNSNGYLEEGDNGAVIIKAGVHHVNAKGCFAANHNINNHAAFNLYIRKNGNTISRIYVDSDYANTSESLVVFSDYIEVKEGDKIQLYFACDNENGSIFGRDDSIITQMSVQVVD